MKASDWISVKDRLPRVKGSVLVCCQDSEQQWIEFATLKREDFNQLIWRDVCGNLLSTVTHWQKIVFPKKRKDMRTIKFRGKNYDGMWMYGYLMPIKSPIHLDCKYSISVSPSALKSVDRILYEVETNTIGQYTGLKDKNGNDIYEGDIVKITEMGGYCLNYVGVVVYDDKTCSFMIDISAMRLYSSRKSFKCGNQSMNDGHCIIEWHDEYEVLGNIHDNPDLLTNKEQL